MEIIVLKFFYKFYIYFCNYIFILYFTGNFYLVFNSDSNLTQTEMLIQKLFPDWTQTLTWTLILTLEKANEKSADEYFSFLFYSL